MNTMQEKYGQQNFTVVAVNMDQERSAADKFLAQYPAHFTVRYDPEGDLAKDFDVSTMPTSFILDAQGQIQSAHRGFLSQKTARYEAAIARLVKNNQQLRNPQL
jgi:peroxiredoxin